MPARTVKAEQKLGQCIRDRREEVGMSGAELARRLYVTRERISQIERGSRAPTTNLLKGLAEVLDLNLDKLKALVPTKKPAKTESLSTQEASPMGKFLRERRITLGLTVKELAKRAGVSAVTLGSFEAGRSNPQGRTLKRLTNALNSLGVTVPEEIFGESGSIYTYISCLAGVVPEAEILYGTRRNTIDRKARLVLLRLLKKRIEGYDFYVSKREGFEHFDPFAEESAFKPFGRA